MTKKQVSFTLDQVKQLVLAYLQRERPDLKAEKISNVQKTIESQPRFIVTYDESEG